MRRRLIILLVLIVGAPVTALTWMGARVAREERASLARQLDGVYMARLRDAEALIVRLLAERRLAMRKLTDLDDLSAATIRARLRREPLARHIFVLGSDGKLRHPDLTAPLTDAEKAFLRRTENLWSRGDQMAAAPEREQGVRNIGDSATDEGWYTWYWENGLHLLYWRRQPDGTIVGAELDRARLLADVIAALPAETPADPLREGIRVVLADARGETIYQWGPFEPGEDVRPRVERSLGSPLGGWSLETFVSDDTVARAAGGKAVWLGVGGGVGALVVLLVALGILFYRESSRDMRDASQRVSFVNQVSHELKTPLTNIRMYAELLERRIDDSDPKARKHLGIIVSESQRLSRLINNVLTFAREQKRTLELRTRPELIDDIVREVVDQFRPALDGHGIEVSLQLAASNRVDADRDVIAQIVANLVSNVEKYAAAGEHLAITTSQRSGSTTITVMDRGPGIPAEAHERIFDDFARLDGALTEGVSGTGIGLSLARRLARLHGGDLVVTPSETGARFSLTLSTPAPEKPDARSGR